MTRRNQARSLKVTGRLADLARAIGEAETTPRKVIPAVTAHLSSRVEAPRKSRLPPPSEMARADWCGRPSYYRIRQGTWAPKTDRFSLTMQSIFDEGHQIHDKWQTWLKESGKLWGDWQCELCHIWKTCRADQL